MDGKYLGNVVSTAIGYAIAAIGVAVMIDLGLRLHEAYLARRASAPPPAA
jgi:hypothetical protein